MEDKTIVIFSTHILNEEGKLFNEPTIEVASKSVPYQAFEAAQFSRILNMLIKKDVTEHKLSDFLKERLKAEASLDDPENPEAKSFERINRSNSNITWEKYVNKRVNNVLTIPDKKERESTVMSWISFWNLKTDLIAELIVDYATGRDIPLKLKDKDVFAIKSLDVEERDNCAKDSKSEWIMALVNFAKDYSNGSNMKLYLILHDKDLSSYRGKDTYVCTLEESKKLSGEDNCTVIFFAHTTNQFVKILRKPLGDRNICSEVDMAIQNYQDIKKKKSESSDWLKEMTQPKPDDFAGWTNLNQKLNNRNNELHQLLTSPDK